MENNKEPKVFRKTIAFAEDKENQPMNVSIGDAPASVEQIINGEYNFLSLMEVNHLYAPFFKILYRKVFPHLPQNWDLEEFILESCKLVPSDVRYKSDEQIKEDLMYETIDYIIESFSRWEPFVLEVDPDDVTAYNVQLMESYLVQEKVLAKVYYKNKYILTIIETILDLFDGLKKLTTLKKPKIVDSRKPSKKSEPNHLLDIWLKDQSQEKIESTFRRIIKYLVDEGFVIIQNDNPVWAFTKQNALNRLLAGFLYKCQEEGYIKLGEYSAPKLKAICENTFNISMKDSKAFQPSALINSGPDYANLFDLFPTCNN
jgi:hypothetical protein